MKTTLVIGTRGSELALKQADIARRTLLGVEPKLQIQIKIIKTHGDMNQEPIPLDTIGKGWFTKEIESALFNMEIDLAVHSLKDMAEEMPIQLTIGAYLPREDARDVLITKNGESLEELQRDAVIGTDSLRRQVQMRALRRDVRMESLRGNVPSRLHKLESGSYDAIILAAAGLKRLGLTDRITRYFTPHEMTPAPGQGILAVQVRENDPTLRSILASINDLAAARAAHIERSFSGVMGGGCKAPTGAYVSREGDQCRFVGMTVDTDMKIIREETRTPWERNEKLGELLAKRLLRNRERHA